MKWYLPELRACIGFVSFKPVVDNLDPCGSGLAREGGVSGDLSFVGCVHIRFFGNGGWRFRPYGDSLFYKRLKKEAKNAR
ncbi:hypothetical protein, partial [Pseudomonas sp. GM33]|uniref:hypothetical protein n=1 Tax=Pseudomonas sp. GM33 TaxID=1144329 RepID=UPI001EE66833